MFKITNKIVLITGASSGIGKACAELFAQQGAKLILCARREDRLNKLKNELINKYNSSVFAVKLDVSDRHAVDKCIKNLPREWQSIAVLINNAGLALGFDKVHVANIDDWEVMIDTNIKALLYVTKAVLDGMIERRAGHIINIGSIAGHEVYSNASVYIATKHAVDAITRCLRLDLAEAEGNIRVTSIDPGMVVTEFSEVRFKGDKQKAAKVYEGMTPLSADDIADAVFYCASRPEHVNVSDMIIYPTDQAGAGFSAVKRKNK